MKLYTYTCRIHFDAIIKTSEDFFKKIYLSLYLKGCVWEGVGDWTKTATYWTPQPLRTSPCVVLVLLGCCSAGGPAAHCVGCGPPLPHLVTNGSQNCSGGPEGPFCRVVAFSTTSCLQLLWPPTHWLPVFTELYNSSIAHSIFGMACLIVIKRK